MSDRDDPLGVSRPLVPPLHLSSVYTYPDLDSLERVSQGKEAGYIYARDRHPNADHLAGLIARYEAGEWAAVTSSGMAAVSLGLLALLSPGDRVVAAEQLYGRTGQLLGELNRWGVEVERVDAGDLKAVGKALSSPARMVVVESISNPCVRVADLPAIAEFAGRRGAAVMVDNTFATPALFRPLEQGADLVVESLTKLIGGHSDVTLGALAGRDGDFESRVRTTSSVWGFSPPPFDCWLAARGLETLPLRVAAATANAQALAEWLELQPAVVRVDYPGLPSHPDHALTQRLLPNGAGTMLAVELRGGRDGVNRFMKAAPGIPFSPSLGHTGTTCSHPASTSHRPLAAAERKRLGIGDGLLRVSVGIEPISDLRDEFARGLKRL